MSLFDQVNTKENSNEDALKEKHVPIISVSKIGDNKCRVKVDAGGGGKHPNEMDHFIQWVEIQIDDLYVGRTEFSAGIMDPFTEFVINCKTPCSISVLSRCNKHGLWLNKVTYKG